MDRAQRNMRDANLIETKALSNGAGSVSSTGFDLGALTNRGIRPENVDFEIVAPALTTTQLPDAQTMTYKVETDDNSGFTSPVTLYDKVIVQTGAGGAGAAAATKRYKIPPNAERYIRITATKTGTGDCSTVSLTHQLRF